MKNKRLAAAGCILCALFCAAVLIFVIFKSSVSVQTDTETEKKAEIKRVTLCAVGDNLIHSPIYKKCKTENGYNFDGLYAHISDFVKQRDIAAINQETIFAENEADYSGYPLFGTPPQVGDSIVRAGFNVVTSATNHTYDKGRNAVLHTLDFWDKYTRITLLGINRTEEDAHKIQIMSVNGIKIAFFNFTYGLNGHRLPADAPYLVNLIDNDENAELLKKAENTADITVVFVHFGTEYTHYPTNEQKKTVELLCESGADIIIGAHPHVLQPVTSYTSKNNNTATVFWSLGNFISNQDSAEKILGGMADITIEKSGGRTYVSDCKLLPTVTHADNDGYCAYLLADYTDKLAAKHRRVGALSVEKLNALFERIVNIDVR